ncbi:Major allergen Mal f 1 [Beauveria bassiana]|uniref:Major allergen Mal f 1 n=1 Tax=Beauveria bassiana TaxID=176275 RepID=A0A2N6NPW3_BEABA|nr:Major allergen Mal f 1 [Beauveria bassiana]
MVASSLLLALVPLAAAGPLAACKPPTQTQTQPQQTCTAPRGNITVRQPGLYPENADYDPKRCVAYVGNLYESVVSVWDPAKNEILEVIELPDISHNAASHVSGVQVDVKHDKLTIAANAGAAFDTSGVDISGTNFLVQYDLTKREVEWKRNLTEISKGVYGGFQDMEHDPEGNSFVIGTFPSSIIKVSANNSKAEPWFVDVGKNTTVHGFTGIAAFNEGRNILVSDNERGQILRFDTSAEKGEPVVVTLKSGTEPIGSDLDGAILPSIYENKVFLVSDDILGTIVLRSEDNWETAEKVGVVPNRLGSVNGFATATVQIVDRIYAVTEWFLDNAPGGSLNRTSFPFYDITDDINKLLA